MVVAVVVVVVVGIMVKVGWTSKLDESHPPSKAKHLVGGV